MPLYVTVTVLVPALAVSTSESFTAPVISSVVPLLYTAWTLSPVKSNFCPSRYVPLDGALTTLISVNVLATTVNANFSVISPILTAASEFPTLSVL